MGIKNLLKTFSSIEKSKNIKQYEGQVAGVDALCWMHQATYKFAKDKRDRGIHLYINGKQNFTIQEMVPYFTSKLKMLRLNYIKCIMVFDGAKLAQKKVVEDERQKLREQALVQVNELQMQSKINEANKKYMESIEIDHDMIHLFIQELKSMKVEYIVAPFESDAQLAFLYKQKKIDLVISEDSDLLAYGV